MSAVLVIDRKEVLAESTGLDVWVRLTDAKEITSLGETFLKEAMNSGRLRSIKAGRCRRIPLSALKEFMASFDGSGDSV